MRRLLISFGIVLVCSVLAVGTVGCGGSSEPTAPEEYSPYPPEDTIDSGKSSDAEESEG